MLRPPHDDVTARNDGVRRRLSGREQCDLGLLFASGLVSTALFSAPLLLQAPPQIAAVPPQPIVASTITVVASKITVEAAPARQAAVIRQPEMRRAARDSRRGVALRVSHVQERRRFKTPENAVPDVVIARASMPLAKKLGRLVVGDGRYTVRPFPVVDPQQ